MRGPAAALLAAALVAACANGGGPPPLIAARIPVGVSPGAPVVGLGAIWVPQPNEGRLLKVDPAGGRVVASLLVGDRRRLQAAGCEPFDVHQATPNSFIHRCDIPTAVEPGPGALWLARDDTQDLEALDPATLRVERTIHVGHPVWDLAVAGGTVWVTSYYDSVVLAVDIDSGAVRRVRGDIPVGPADVLAAYGYVWVAMSRWGLILKIDPGTAAVVDRIPVAYAGSRPLPLLAAAGSLWCRLESADAVVRIDPGTDRVLATVKVGIFYGIDGVDRLAFDGRTLWVGGLRVQGITPAAAAVTRTLPVTGTALDYGFGHLWGPDVGGPLYELNV